MPQARKTQPCPVCGGKMRFEQRPDQLAYKGESCTVETLAWWCLQCGEAILSGAPLVARERAFTELKARVDQVLSPAQVAKVREKLGLSQRKASELLGGGRNAFQRYEAGIHPVSVPMSNLLVLLRNDPKRLDELYPGHRRTKC